MSKNKLPYCTYIVREEEAEEYIKNGVDNLMAIPKCKVHDWASTIDWIIKNTPEDVIFIADDDIHDFLYRMEETSVISDMETVENEIVRIAQLIVDLNIGLAYDQMVITPYGYTCEFHFTGMPGQIRWINKLALKYNYNKDDVCMSDIDMAMQEWLSNRITLQPRYFISKADMSINENEVGADRKEHLVFVDNMKNKWGKYYDYDYKRNIAKINVKR